MNSVDLLNSIIGNEHSLASEITSMWTSWKNAKQIHEDRQDEVEQYLYATSTNETSNYSNHHEHSTHRPKLTQIFDNLKANYLSGLMPSEYWFTFEGNDAQSVNKETRRLVEGYLSHKHRQSKFNQVIEELMDDWLLGNAFAGVTFVNETHEEEDGTLRQGYRGPRIYRINPRDIVFNPKATSFRDSPKIIRVLKTLGQLARDIGEIPEMGYLQEIFDRMIEVRNHCRGMKPEEIDKSKQLTYDGFGTFSQYITGDTVELLEFYGDIYDLDEGKLYKNHVITVVDRLYVIRKEPCPTYDGKPAIFHAGYRRRRDNLYSMGALDNLVGMQYYINHLENSRADAFDAMLLPDRVILGDVEEQYEDKSTGQITYYISSQGDVRNLAPDPTVLNADFKINEMEDKMELYAGAPREAMGIRSPGEKTAFEVEQLINAAGRFFQLNLSRLESDFIEPIINAELQMAKRYFGSASEQISFLDPETGTYLFEEISEEDLIANGALVPVGASHFSRRAKLAQSLSQIQQVVLASDEEVRNHFPSVRIAEIWEELLEFEAHKLVQPYGRIPERLQAERLTRAAQRAIEDEEVVPDDEEVIQEEEEGFDELPS